MEFPKESFLLSLHSFEDSCSVFLFCCLFSGLSPKKQVGLALAGI
jgi:hypothetical protein